MKSAFPLTFIVVLSSIPALGQTLVIDDFTVGTSFDAVASEGSPVVSNSQSGLNPANVLGGARELAAEFAPDIMTAGGAAFADFDAPSQRLIISAQVTSESADTFGAIKWSGISPFSPVDFTGLTSFEVIVASASTSVPAELAIQASDGNVQVSVARTPISSATPQVIMFPFHEFTGVDFSNIESLSLVVAYFGLATGESYEFAISSVTAVPEPALPALLALAVGIALIRRSRMLRKDLSVSPPRHAAARSEELI